MRRFPTAAHLRHSPLRRTPSAGLWHTPPSHSSAHIGGLPRHAAVSNSGTQAHPFGTPLRRTPSAGLWHTPPAHPRPHRRPPRACGGSQERHLLWHNPSAGLWHIPPAHPFVHIGGLPGHAAAPNSDTLPAAPSGTPPRQGYGTPSGAPLRPHRRPPRACGGFQQRHPSSTPPPAHPPRQGSGAPSNTPPRQGCGTHLGRAMAYPGRALASPLWNTPPRELSRHAAVSNSNTTPWKHPFRQIGTNENIHKNT